MRWLASLFLMIALSLNTPGFCAHALGMDRLQAASQDMANHAHMNHDMSLMNHDMSEDDHTNHCPDGCDGGQDCQGCSAISSAIFTHNDFGLHAVPETLRAWVKTHPIHFSTLLDPPPPKLLS